MIQLPIMSVVVGSTNKFRGIPEPGQRNNRPLTVNAWSQTTGSDFSYLYEIENREQQSQKEKELEEKVRALEKDLKVHSDLLTQIHATSARSTALLSQQQPQQSQQQYINNIGVNNNNNMFSSSSRTPQSSSKIVNAINSIQHVNCSPNESVKYTIIAEGTGNHSDEPIEIQLAKDDGALNLNSSSDSGRLEICQTPEENIEMKTENNSGNNSMTMHNQSQPMNTTPSEHHIIKRRKLASDQLVTKYESPEQTITSYSNTQTQPKSASHKRRSSGNSLLKPPKVQITNDLENVMVSIGPNNTRIPAKLYENMNWTSASIATRKLLMTIFDRKVLATHSMTGKPSPAFKDHDKPIKQMLDPLVIADIIFAVTRKCQVSDKEVRNAITTKCADENKMMKLQMNKRMPMRENNKENLVG